jgi:hypothetical protein
VIEKFGPRRHPISRLLGVHEGIDIAAQAGSPVVAADGGKVSAVFRGLTGGKTIDVTHPDGLRTRYCHLSTFLVKVGDEVKANVFTAGDHVDVTGISKGKGYAGVIKRWGAHRTPMTHGGGPVHRHAGSMGSNTDPSRIYKGKIGAGHMGDDQVTVLNLDVVKVDPEYNLIAVRGAIPGPKNGIVFVKSTTKNILEKKGEAGISTNPQKASARVNPQKASARKA